MNPNDPKIQSSVGKTPEPIAPKGNSTVHDQSAMINDLRTELDHLTRSRDTEVTSLIRTQRYLQKLLFGMLLAAVFMALGTSLFFVKQMKSIRQQLEALRSSTTDGLRDFNGRVEPEIHRFAEELQSFSATNPDFRPVLEEFQPRLPRYFSTFVPSSSTPYAPMSDPQSGAP